jgi:hypothetical protein
MQVKDYLQSLADDNKIRVEKIGSGNWYWSFPSDEKKAKETALEKAQEEYNKAAAIVADLQAKVDEAGAAREEDEDLRMGSGMALLDYSRTCAHISRWRPQGPHHSSCRSEQRTRESSTGVRCLQ